MKKRFLGEICIITGALLWGAISLFSIPLAEAGFSSYSVVVMRALLSAAGVAVIILIKDRRLFKIALKDLPLFLGSSLLGFGLLNLCYMASIGQNGSSVAAMLMYTSPVWMVLLSRIIFKEKITAVKIISLVLVMAGCAMTALGGTLKITVFGLFLGLGSGLGFALYGIFGKLAERKYNTLTITFYTFFIVALVLIPFADFSSLFSGISKKPVSLVYFSLASFVSTVAPYLVFTYGLKSVPAGKAGILSVLELVMATVVGLLFYPEKNNLGVVGFMGIAVVIIALVLMEGLTPRRKPEDSEKEKYLVSEQPRSAENSVVPAAEQPRTADGTEE